MIAVFGVTAIISKPRRSFPHWLASIVLLVICGQSTGSVQGHDTTLSLTATSHLLTEAPRTHAPPPPPPPPGPPSPPAARPPGQYRVTRPGCCLAPPAASHLLTDAVPRTLDQPRHLLLLCCLRWRRHPYLESNQQLGHCAHSRCPRLDP